MDLTRIINQIRSCDYPVRVFIRMGAIEWGAEYPGGCSFTPVGSYQKQGFSEEQLREDCALSMAEAMK